MTAVSPSWAEMRTRRCIRLRWKGVAGPIHLLAIVSMGMLLFDECDFEDLGREAAKRKRWVFLFTAVPIAVPGGTGSPINPIATY